MNDNDFDIAASMLSDGELLANVERLADKFLYLHQSNGVSQERRAAAKVICGRLNVAAFEIRHCLDALPRCAGVDAKEEEHLERISGNDEPTLF